MKTYSICNHCYKKISADIVFRLGKVYLLKVCCNERQEEVIEVDENFYRELLKIQYSNILGSMVNIAITDKCNTSCTACYCKMGGSELSVDEVLGMAHTSPLWINKYILTGGEPTLHSRFFEIVSQLNCGLITNGIKFNDFNFLKEFAKHKVYWSNDSELSIMFSLNTVDSKNYQDKLDALENFRRLGLKTALISVTITDIEQLPMVIDELRKLKDVSSAFKIRSAFNIGQSEGFKHIYLSEIVRYLKDRANVFRFIEGLNSHTYLINVKYDDLHLVLVKCPDKTTLDMGNIGPCNPYQYTHFKTFENTMVALIINEGIEKGYFNGLKIDGCKNHSLQAGSCGMDYEPLPTKQGTLLV